METVKKLTAWDIALGLAPSDDVAVANICGARNDYNSRGNGSTMARRVLRGGQWVWLSAPASRGRYLAEDRHDETVGPVFGGEIMATFTLGSNGSPVPDTWHLIRQTKDEKGRCLIPLSATRIREGYRLSLANGSRPETLDVSDPSWR